MGLQEDYVPLDRFEFQIAEDINECSYRVYKRAKAKGLPYRFHLSGREVRSVPRPRFFLSTGEQLPFIDEFQLRGEAGRLLVDLTFRAID